MAIYGLPSLADILWMYMNGLTSMGCNTYMEMPSIQASDHQNCGPRFYRICKPPSHPQGYVYYDKVPMAIYGLPPLSGVLWVYGTGLTSLWCNTYMGMPFIQAIDHQNCGPRFFRVMQTDHKSLPMGFGLLCKVTVAMYGLPALSDDRCIVDIWERSHKPGI